MQNCPICSSKIRPDFYRFHQRSFLDNRFRHALSPLRPLGMCEKCFYIRPESPFFEFDKTPLSESFIKLDDPRDLVYERILGKRMLATLKKVPKVNIKKITSVLDLRALTGGTLETLREENIGRSYAGFDFFSKNIAYSRSRRNIELSFWNKDFEDANKGMKINTSKKDLIYSSRPILELCSAPRVFLETMKRILSPEGLCIFTERDLSSYEENIFLNELFTPWGNSFFTRENLRHLFLKEGFEIIGEDRENCYISYIIKPIRREKRKDLTKPNLDSFQANPYQKFPRFEETKIKRYWQGRVGSFNAGLSILKHFLEPKRCIRYHSVQERYLDVIVVSCGRKRELKRTLKSFQKSVISDKRKYRFIIHDDIPANNKREYEDCRKFINESNIFSKKLYAKENRGIGESIKTLLKEVETKYYFHLEDDFLFLRKIYLDPLIDILDQYKEVNSIRFNKVMTTPHFHTLTKSLGDVHSRQYRFNGQILTLVPYWSHNPNIARTDSPFTRLILSLSGYFRERHENIELLKDCANHEDIYEKMGTFIYGPLYQARIVYHCDYPKFTRKMRKLMGYDHSKSMRKVMLDYRPQADERKTTIDDFRTAKELKIH